VSRLRSALTSVIDSAYSSPYCSGRRQLTGIGLSVSVLQRYAQSCRTRSLRSITIGARLMHQPPDIVLSWPAVAAVGVGIIFWLISPDA
jgi:hypothetical protein